MNDYQSGLAKLTWRHPQTGEEKELVLERNANVSIGRVAENEICIPEQHVSRRHSVVSYDPEMGGFVVKDAGSSNGTFLNDKQVLTPTLLSDNDVVRLYVPTIRFSSLVTEHDRTVAAERGTLIAAVTSTGRGKLIITTGPQEGNSIPLLLHELTVGRATSNANWEIALQDPSVSRPHAKLKLIAGEWMIYDLSSINGTQVNGKPIDGTGRKLRDGDIVAFGSTLALFRAG
ncbi:MAG: FHA domain-containing protein [Phototrophicaceae bacterium]|jgi:pSer/pThr/pTyr-binding forkhead associated (FHA) protein